MKKVKNPSWNFYLDRVNPCAFYEKVFSKEECQEIIKIANNKSLIKGITLGDTTNVRESKICWLYAADDLEWAFKKLTDIILNANDRFFNFDIFGLNEGLQFTNYKAPSDKYGKHTDRRFGTVVRKLSISIQLTDPKEYEGGELYLYEDEKGA